MNPLDQRLRKAKDGDINAFHDLYNEFQPQLKSYLYRLCADRNDAEDLNHDTFVRAFDKLRSFSGAASLKTWVFRIATNLTLDMLKKRKPWPIDAQDQSREASMKSSRVLKSYLLLNRESPAGAYEIREHIDFCFTCLAKSLPIEQQVALILKEVYQFKIKEIAKILETTDPRTKHMLHSSRKKMIEIFDDRCSLINKSGSCYQCTELNGVFNFKLKEQSDHLELEMVQSAGLASNKRLLELRTRLIRNIDPLNAEGTELHDYIMQRVRKVIGEIP